MKEKNENCIISRNAKMYKSINSMIIVNYLIQKKMIYNKIWYIWYDNNIIIYYINIFQI